MQFFLTPEQIEIVETAKALEEDESLKVNAFAGTGKTTTLKAITNAIPNKTFLYLAFNSDIVKEAKKKLPANVFICTTHSLAYRKIIKEDNYKISNKTFNVHDVAEILDVNYKMAHDVHKIFNMFCNSSYLEINNVSKDYTAHHVDAFHQTQILYDKMKYRMLDVEHSFYLKEYQLCNYAKDLKFDYILLDEGQDTNSVTLAIYNSITNSRKIIVGDTHQTIYQFRGSVNAMEIINTTYCHYLTTTFRCNKYIVELANNVLTKFKREKIPLVSGIEFESDEIKQTAYITRTNAQIITLIQKLDDFNCMKDIDEIFGLSFAVLAFLEKKKLPYKFSYLENFKNRKELENHIDEFNDIELKGALKNALMYKRYLYVLYNKAKNNHSSKSKSILITAHASKGLEWDKVVIERDFKILSTIENHHELEQEANLLYVVITRAKKSIYFKNEGILDDIC